MKKIIIRIFAVILVLASLALICYPFISNYLMERQQESQIVEYTEKIEKVEDTKKAEEYERARQYNLGFSRKVVITDPFDPNFQMPLSVEYNEVLSLGEDGLMGTVEIPKIDLKLPIFHGTSDDVLSKGVGHLQNTSLPIGGKSTH